MVVKFWNNSADDWWYFFCLFILYLLSSACVFVPGNNEIPVIKKTPKRFISDHLVSTQNMQDINISQTLANIILFVICNIITSSIIELYELH